MSHKSRSITKTPENNVKFSIVVSYIYNALMNGAELQISVEKGL